MMRFRLLGPLEVRAAGEWQGIGAPKWRSLLAVLLVKAGQAVPVDTLVEELWGGAPPAKAANLVSIYVLRLRRLLGDADGSLLVTRAPGYLLRPGPDGTDVQQFEGLIRAGRQAFAAGQADAAAAHLAEALALWRGRPLADVPPTPLVEAAAARLGELRLDAVELRLAADLSRGSPTEAVSELRGLVAEQPLREGLWVLLMRALDAAGRHAEALEVYGLARAAIAGQLGVEPGAELRRLYAELLDRDTSSAGLIAAGSVRAGRDASEPAETVSPSAAGRPGVPVPAQLPADIADFTGREDQVKRLCELLAGPIADGQGANGADGVVPIALVAGSGGLGKTSLAVHAAHRVRGSFPDGQLYVDLLGATATPLTAADVLARFLRDLGVDGRRIPAEPDERAAWYRSSLAGRRILVVLDNARDAAQVRPLLPGTGSSAVLVTTRSRMPDLASTRLVDLNVLADTEALTLFTKVVGDERAAAEPEATAELLLACAGLPLAIRICAARLATRPGWTIGAMATRLRDTRRRLDEMRVGDLAVRASFQVSFASLPADTPPAGVAPADAFRLLGLWPGPSISAAAAAALFGSCEDQAADALETLVDTHLLESTGPDRYKFHDLLRVYSSERAEDLPAAVRDAAGTRLLAWYAAAADAAATAVLPHRYDIPLDLAPEPPEPPRFYGPEDALAWYDDERANLVAATRHASALGLYELAWRLPAPLFMVFDSRGNLADCITTHRIALEAARRAGHRPGEAWVLNNLGESLGATRESEGIGYLEQSLAIRHEIADHRGEAQVANNLADAYQRLGRADEALGLLKRALELNQQLGYSYGEGVALGNLGSTLLDLGRAVEAVDYLLQARQVFSDIGYLAGEGYVLHILGRCYSALGQDADALTCLEQALATHRSTGNRQQEAATLRSVGTAQRRAGLADGARASWTRAAAAFDELGDPAQAAEIRAELVASGI